VRGSGACSHTKAEEDRYSREGPEREVVGWGPGEKGDRERHCEE